MASGKNNKLKKVGNFVSNELLGVDDARRAVRYAKQGKFGKAIKSAAAGALEVATTASVAGKGPSIAGKLAAKSVKKTVEKDSTKIGQKMGQKIAESTKASKYPSSKGKNISIKLEGKSSTTSRSGGKSVSPDSSKFTGTKKSPTEKQRLGSYQAQETKRNKQIVSGASQAKEISKTVLRKSLAEQRVKDLARGAVTVKTLKESNSKKK